MLLKKPLLFLIVVVPLFGCGPRSIIRITPECTKSSFAGATLGVVVCKDRIQIGCADEVGRCLGGENDPVGGFCSFFTEFFAPRLKGVSRFKTVTILSGFDRATLHEKRIESNKHGAEWDLMVPSDATAAQDSIRYLLIFSRIAVGSELTPGSQWMVLASGESTMKQSSLMLSAIVALWDSKTRKEVAYGVLNVEAGSQMAISKSTWFELLDEVAKGIAERMEFTLGE
jgi:hypothetical protein